MSETKGMALEVLSLTRIAERIGRRELVLPVLAAVLVVGAPALLGLLRDECPTDDHADWSDQLGEIQEIMDGELARGRRMEVMARDIHRAHHLNEGYRYALHAEAR